MQTKKRKINTDAVVSPYTELLIQAVESSKKKKSATLLIPQCSHKYIQNMYEKHNNGKRDGMHKTILISI